MFFNVEACNLYKNEEKYETIVKSLRLLMQYNVYVEMLIEGSYSKEIDQNIFCLVES